MAGRAHLRKAGDAMRGKSTTRVDGDDFAEALRDERLHRLAVESIAFVERLARDGRDHSISGGLLPTRCLNEGPTDMPACPPGECICHRLIGG